MEHLSSRANYALCKRPIVHALSPSKRRRSYFPQNVHLLHCFCENQQLLFRVFNVPFTYLHRKPMCTQTTHLLPFDQSYHQHQDVGLHDVERLVNSLCENGQLDRVIDVLSCIHTPLPEGTYVSIFRSCKNRESLNHVRQVVSHLTRYRPSPSRFVKDYLVMTLAHCDAIEDAFEISSTLPHLSSQSWTAILTAYTAGGDAAKALEVYQCMLQDGAEPNPLTFVSLFKACGIIQDLEEGKKLHVEASRRGLTSNHFVANTLVSMYGKCGGLVEAEDVFSMLSQRDVVSWNAMLSAYVDFRDGKNALLLYRQMLEEDATINHLTIVCAIEAVSILIEEEQALFWRGTALHAMCLEIWWALYLYARMKGFYSNKFVNTTLLTLSVKCGAIAEAEQVFISLPQHDVVSWNAMISGYVMHGQEKRALQLYRHMQREGVSPDELTLVFSLQACGSLAEKTNSLGNEDKTEMTFYKIGRALASDAHKNGYCGNATIGTALVSMYGRCGAFSEAEAVFLALSNRDMVAYTAMLLVYVEQGEAEEALSLFAEMQKEAFGLDDVTLICLLQACGDTGSSQLCEQLHFGIVSVGYDGVGNVGATLINAYGGCARVSDGEAVMDGLLEVDIVVWTACIASHASAGSFIATLYRYEELTLSGLNPCGTTFVSVLSVCSHTGAVVEGLEYFASMAGHFAVCTDLKHYGKIVDLLGRAGNLPRVENVLGKMPMQPAVTIWTSILYACCTHGNLPCGQHAFDQVVNMVPNDACAYLLMSSLCAEVGKQQESLANEEESGYR